MRFLVLGLSIVVACASVWGAEIRGSWSPLAAMPTARQEVAFSTAQGKLYVIGGLGGGTAFEAYDTETGQWDSLPPLPVDLHHGSAASLEGRIYSIGGFAGNGPLFGTPLSQVYEFDPQRGSWQERAPLPSPRGGLFSVSLGGRIYTIGGRDAFDSLAAVTIYDPSDDSWSAAASMPAALDHLAAAELGGRIYVAGGRLTQGGGFVRNDASLLIYDPDQDAWQSGAPLPTPRSGHSAAAVSGFLLVLGGEIPGVFSVNEAYDPAHDRWFRLDDLLTARHGLAVGVIGKRVITAGGGVVDGLAPSAVAEEFRVLDQVASLAQLGVGPTITSQLVISNPGEQTARSRVEFHRGDQAQDFEVSLDGERGSAFETEIAPGALKIFTSDPQQDTVPGGVTLYSDAPLLSNVLFSDPQQGFAGVAGLTPARRFFVSILRDLDQSDDSGLAVADASGLQNTVTLQLIDDSGQMVTQTQRTLQPFGHFAALFDELWEIEIFFQVFNGSIRIEAEHEVGAVAILLRGNQFATLPVKPLE